MAGVNNFNNINKISMTDLTPQLQFQIGLITGIGEDLGGIYPGATKVENLGGGQIKINDVAATVYTHPQTHHVGMITGLSAIATSGNYNDLVGVPTSLPASDVSAWAKAITKPTYNSTEVGAISMTLKGTVNGVAELDDRGKIPTDQFPPTLYELVSQSFLPIERIPVLDVTEKLTDNENVSLVMGGLNSSMLI